MKERILFVDDDEVLQDFITESLTEKGYEVKKAVNGLEALEIVENFHPDLILLDVVMPIMNGYVTCQKLREQEEHLKVPIVFLTDQGDDWNLLMGYSKGCDVFLSKPTELNGDYTQKLHEEIEKVLKN